MQQGLQQGLMLVPGKFATIPYVCFSAKYSFLAHLCRNLEQESWEFHEYVAHFNVTVISSYIFPSHPPFKVVIVYSYWYLLMVFLVWHLPFFLCCQ